VKWSPITIVVALVVVVIAAYGGYRVFNHFNKPQPKQSAPSTTTQSNTAQTSNIYMMKTDPAKGSYLTDFQGITLYTLDKDTTGVSNCTGSCATAWPPYTSGATAQSTFPTNITVITRADGSKQFAWKGMPLYYFASDTKAGQITGDGLNGFHLAK